ncbi:MAG TPA: hypothetical protein VKA10_04555 [Prolixibacteraceae bacterium]|nr:hypothetical protein [Prolixibacteraceae bacterium]
MTRDEYKILLQSFAEVFPWSTLWVMNDAHTILLGRKKVSQNFTLAEIGNKFDASGARTYLMESGLVNEADILSHFWMNNQALKKYVDESSLNTDNRPVIEFSRVVSRAPDSGVLHDLTVNFQSIETLLDEPEYSGQLFERIELKQYELRERLRFYIKQLE